MAMFENALHLNANGKVAQFLVDQGLSPKNSKKITGKWATWTPNDKNSRAAKLANYLDENLGDGTVKNVQEEFRRKDGSIAGDIDVKLKNYNIEVKDGNVKTEEVLFDVAHAIKTGKKYILFAPKIQGTVAKNLEAECGDLIKIFRKEKDLTDYIRNNPGKK